ncbi:TIR domain-containing protein [Streptosporangium sp. NPDC004379]|uniref:TIR domain-containing protein n=1 Tax=Streptosporangium sp. NPDC004379 TaxID=3366189 RepID=UPI0036A890E1
MVSEVLVAEDSGPDPRKVFVIHGRDDRARKAMFSFLRAIGLDPIEWSQAISMTGKASPYIGEVLDAVFGAAQAVVVLQTPDDIAYLHPSLTHPDDPECEAQPQARPNVLFEAGMAMGRSPDRTVIVELGKVKVFSDIHGRHAVRLNDSIAKRQDLAHRLQSAGCAVNLTGRDWHEAGDLTPPSPPGGGLPLGRKLPSTKAAGEPHLDAKYINRGGNKINLIEVTNYGPGDVYELNIESDEQLAANNDKEFPVPKLPHGKSVRIMHMSSGGLGSRNNSYFNITVTGKTVDGMAINKEIFMNEH